MNNEGNIDYLPFRLRFDSEGTVYTVGGKKNARNHPSENIETTTLCIINSITVSKIIHSQTKEKNSPGFIIKIGNLEYIV